MEIRRRIEVSGIVQGVGFRPFVYRLASAHGLAGSIANTPAGVTIEVQGPQDGIQSFLAGLQQDAPPLSRITGLTVREKACISERDFRILASYQNEEPRSLVSPDVATCDDCLRELFDPHDRRYRYPFINCTNCGPRFTILRHVPYDRANTSMAAFTMCPACQAEYDDPLNRRFHAQPNACWNCGPQLKFHQTNGRFTRDGDALASAVAALKAGLVVAVKGLGGFHLAVDAFHSAAVALLRQRKNRIEKPFAVMVPDVPAAAELCEISASEREALLSLQRPIVLLRKKHSVPLAEQVAPGNRCLGIFLPYTPLHHLLFQVGGFLALVLTSGNLSEEPLAIDNQEAFERLNRLADCFLVHDRNILKRCDDSVVRISDCGQQMLRRSRGYVPVPVFLHCEVPPILAVGAELKNTLCLTKGSQAFLSQHIGDLENVEARHFFDETIEYWKRSLEIEPAVVACDLHPNYFSTHWAQQLPNPPVAVQHHHAHIASCMGDNHLDGSVIGVALDGTGYGTDGHIWGGEILIANYEQFERLAHLEYVPLPGGDAAIRQPWRMAISYLQHYFGREFLDWNLALVNQVGRKNVELLLRIIERNVNCPLTSSCGRLFDAVAALIGIRTEVNYEAQAAIELEAAISNSPDTAAYPFELVTQNGGWLIRTKSVLEAVLADLVLGVAAAQISARFHNGIAETIAKTASLLRERRSLNRVCLSGGVFQNGYLLHRLRSQLLAAGFEVFTNNQVPCGDGGLSLGQALVAAHIYERARKDESSIRPPTT